MPGDTESESLGSRAVETRELQFDVLNFKAEEAVASRLEARLGENRGKEGIRIGRRAGLLSTSTTRASSKVGDFSQKGWEYKCMSIKSVEPSEGLV